MSGRRRGGKYGVGAPEPAVVFRSAPALLVRALDALAGELYRADYRRRRGRVPAAVRLEGAALEVRARWYREAASRAGISWGEVEFHLRVAFGERLGVGSTLSGGVTAREAGRL
jgi:hypothetical protein